MNPKSLIKILNKQKKHEGIWGLWSWTCVTNFSLYMTLPPVDACILAGSSAGDGGVGTRGHVGLPSNLLHQAALSRETWARIDTVLIGSSLPGGEGLDVAGSDAVEGTDTESEISSLHVGPQNLKPAGQEPWHGLSFSRHWWPQV